MRRVWWALLVVAGAYAADRTLKLFIHHYPNTRWDLLSEHVAIDVSFNSGIAFGLPAHRWLIVSISIIVMSVLLIALIKFYQQKKKFLVIASGMIIAGAFSNLLDRIKFGYVIDYVDISFFTVLNIADILISIGVVLFLLDTFFNHRLDKES